MIGILIAVVVLVGAVAVADLLLSFAVIRRVSALQARMTAGAGGGQSPEVGHRVGDFRVELLGGGLFTRADLEDTRALVVFLMTTCEPCKKAVADLAELPLPLPSPLYVLVTGTHKDRDIRPVAAQLPPGAQVGRISAPDATTEAFGVDGFPTVLRVEDGIVRSSGLKVAGVLEHVGQ
jgi:hypothetical protein